MNSDIALSKYACRPSDAEYDPRHGIFVHKIGKADSVLVRSLELVVIRKQSCEEERFTSVQRIFQLVSELHQSWEEIPVDEVRHEGGLVAS